MTSENINSGFTYVNRNDIYIFRKEEFPKVILHELIHHDLNIHQDNFNDDNNLHKICENYPKKSSVNLQFKSIFYYICYCCLI